MLVEICIISLTPLETYAFKQEQAPAPDTCQSRSL